MAHITYTLAPHFTGHVGPVRFTNGHGETDDPEVAAWFADRPDEYDVTLDGEPYVTEDELQSLAAELDALDDDPED